MMNHQMAPQTQIQQPPPQPPPHKNLPPCQPQQPQHHQQNHHGGGGQYNNEDDMGMRYADPYTYNLQSGHCEPTYERTYDNFQHYQDNR